MHNVIESTGILLSTLAFLICLACLGWSLLRRRFPNREGRVAYLQEDYRRACESGDIAAVDQIEAELWDLRAAPGWPGTGSTGLDQRG
ncbi:hypothetical protein ACFVVC_01750 [Pseudarthrobacter sp. NPDC058196]|uniref:hypothetical protein n=1 Tax=Pseudarthrobacter sp. NPDC058196 TaxID=3346376 RepID=UPI0036DE39EA